MRSRACTLAALAAVMVVAAAAPAGAESPSDRISDPFYKYTGATPLAQITPGTVLKTRTVPYHLADLTLPFNAVQVLYRSTSMTGKPTVNVTSVVKPLDATGPAKLIGYGSFYDSLDPRDEPSMSISGQSNPTLGGALPNVEALLVLPLLSAGYTVSIADTEGQDAAFGAGPVYGMNTLDGLRAASQAAGTGLDTSTKIGLIGYSGGAIATGWAASMAPTYAPDINARLVGATMGGVLVMPDHNLRYLEGSTIWAGVMPMALLGISRAFEVDLTPYMSDYGKDLFVQKQYASIVDALFQFPGLKFSKLTKRQYPTPESVPVYAAMSNKLILGQDYTPTAPLQMFQGAGGEAEGTLGTTPGIGPGDGVMVAGDVRSLARKYCAKGVAVEHKQFDSLSHVGATSPWLDASLPWLNARFAGEPAPNNCAQIAPGNPLDPLPAYVPPGTPTETTTTNETPPVTGAADPPSAPLSAVKRAPTPEGPQVVPTTPTVVKHGKGTVRRVLVRGGKVRITIRCTGADDAVCAVSAFVTARRGGRTVRLGAARGVTLRSGDQITLTIKLNALGRKIANEHGKLKTIATNAL